jgi:hypothetical protein
MADKFELYRGVDGELRWEITSGDGELVSSGDVRMSPGTLAGMSANAETGASSTLRRAWTRLTRRLRH